jgi:hypothetical protein
MTDSMDDFELNIVPGIYGQVEIVSAWDGNVAYLLDNGIKWNAVNLKSMKTFNELYSSQDLAYGDVLITGLGFGIMLRLLEKKKEVKSITVLEISQDVIDAFLQHNKISSKTKIICTNASNYTDDKVYDGVFLDHYEDQVYEWKNRDINKISKNIKHHAFWVWSLEGMFYEWAMGVGYVPVTQERPMVSELSDNFEQFWLEYVEKYFPEERFFLEMDLNKVKKYVIKFYTRNMG